VHTRSFTELAFYVVFKVVGFKASAVQAAMDVIECSRIDCAQLPLSDGVGGEAPIPSANSTATRKGELDRRDALLRQSK
jgi:hypothetical protein